MSRKLCENHNKFVWETGKSPVFRRCYKTATTTRNDFRWGNKKSGEPTVVEIKVNLCCECVAEWDDRMSEGAVEAAGS